MFARGRDLGVVSCVCVCVCVCEILIFTELLFADRHPVDKQSPISEYDSCQLI